MVTDADTEIAVMRCAKSENKTYQSRNFITQRMSKEMWDLMALWSISAFLAKNTATPSK